MAKKHPLPFFSAFDDLGKCLGAASAVLQGTGDHLPCSAEFREDIEHLACLLDAVDCLLKQASGHMEILTPLFDDSLALDPVSTSHGG